MPTDQYQLLPDLTEDEFAALKADIAARGVQVPVELDETGAVLDGHHRLRACKELGLTEWPTIIRTGLTEDDKREHVLALNLNRRHLTREQRAELVRTLRAQGWSLPRIADRLQVSLGTAHADAQVFKSENVTATVTGKDGKHYPATKPKPNPAIITSTPRQTEAALTILQGSSAQPPKPLSTVADLKQAAATAGRQRKEEEEAAKAAEVATSSDRYRVLRMDVRDLAAELGPESVDAIITDPPYPAEFVPLYADLAELAATVLKPGGSMLVMTGQSYLPDILALMVPHIRYHWTLAYMTPGASLAVWHRNVTTGWKPILWFVKGDYAGGMVWDVAKSEQPDKEHHEWGQSVSGMADLIAKVTEAGDCILDPFMGAGTTGLVAVEAGRKFIGADVDETAINSALVRLAEATK